MNEIEMFKTLLILSIALYFAWFQLKRLYKHTPAKTQIKFEGYEKGAAGDGIRKYGWGNIRIKMFYDLWTRIKHVAYKKV